MLLGHRRFGVVRVPVVVGPGGAGRFVGEPVHRRLEVLDEPEHRTRREAGRGLPGDSRAPVFRLRLRVQVHQQRGMELRRCRQELAHQVERRTIDEEP